MGVVFCFCFVFAIVLDVVLSWFCFCVSFCFLVCFMLWLMLRWLISVDYLCNSGSVAVEFCNSGSVTLKENTMDPCMAVLWVFVFGSYCRDPWIRWMDGWMDKMNRWTRWMDGWMDGWMNV